MQETTKGRLDELGRQYYEEVRTGHGESVETRSKRQIEIANEIVSGVTHYLGTLARKLLYGGGCNMSTSHGRILISLRRKNVDIDDLVQTGVEGILRSLQSYRPDRGRLSTFLTYHTVAVMYKYGTCNCWPVYFPQDIAAHAMKAFGSSENRMEVVKKIAGVIGNGANNDCGKNYIALTICGLIGRRNTSISAPIKKRNDWKVHTFEEVYLMDTNNPEPDKVMEKKELACCIRETIEELGPRNARIIKGNFGIGEDIKSLSEIGRKEGLSRERIRQVHNKALKKLKETPSLLELFLEYKEGS